MYPTDSKIAPRSVCFDRGRLRIEDIVDIAEGSACASLSDAPEFRADITRGADFLDRLLREQGSIYGVTTGYGDSCTVTVQPELVAEFRANFIPSTVVALANISIPRKPVP